MPPLQIRTNFFKAYPRLRALALNEGWRITHEEGDLLILVKNPAPNTTVLIQIRFIEAGRIRSIHLDFHQLLSKRIRTAETMLRLF